MPVRIKFYDEDKFFADFEALPQDARTNLLAYLDRLQQNPDNPELHTEDYESDRFVYKFDSFYVVYCHLEREPSELTPLSARVLRIEVLSVEPLNRVLRGKSLYGGIVKRVKDLLGI